jgi:hypothetical protein
MGWAVWIDEREGTAWAQGTHEYRPAGTAVIAITDQFCSRDFRRKLQRPQCVDTSFRGFFGSLEEVNRYLRRGRREGSGSRRAPAYLG